MQSDWRQTSRRSVLKLLGVAAAVLPGAALGALRGLLPAGKQAQDFIEHNAQPLALETARGTYGQGPITPISQFFVRNNLPMPKAQTLAERDLWAFEVTGCENEGVLTLGQLKTLPITTVATVLQCSGNGRAFFDHQPSGSPWGVGAAGCALWTGVRVAEVFEFFGGTEVGARFVTGTGGEPLPEGIDVETVAVERSIPLSKGLQDCLLVWEMNGEPLPHVHGGPLRLLVPGFFGVNNVKWLKKLAASSDESRHKIQQSGYRLRPVGVSGSAEHPSMYRMPVKSWINGPGANGEILRSGRQQLFGIAFSGERGVDSVEVSIDNGQTWQNAELYGPNLGPNAWRTFKLDTELATGRYSVVSRATDSTGETQPRDFPANQRGYGHNGWRDHALTLTVSDNIALATATAPALTVANESLKGEQDTALTQIKTAQDLSEGQKLFSQTSSPPCGVCHSLKAAGARGVIGPNLDELKPSAAQIRAALSQGVGAMPSYAKTLSEAEINALVKFITTTY